ncbi:MULTISPECIES: PspC domain-containing protein [Oceanotoga]|uniref:Phage shock protein C (PspC) family protein n=1 Tax=Oceanotoga teriensis TaxID=515440 RepID=A0AA45C834_9BACT|nr:MULTISPECIES: PspC domain-containing protein [Oceanotoga]PWJ95911.1 phage shock protein C (PspC) family protein [Oceanotoga teriensis]
MNKRLYKSISDRKISGICGGIAEYFNIDPTIIRLLFFALIFAGGFGIIAYIVGMIIIPEKTIIYGEKNFKEDFKEDFDYKKKYEEQNKENF